MSTTAGGDLSGSLPNPTVAKVNGITVTGTPSTGQILTASSTSAASWSTPATAPVSSVAGRTGAVTLSVTDVSGAVASSSVGVASGVAGLDANTKLSTFQMPDSVQAIIVESSGSYALRSTVTNSATRPVIWRGPDSPTIGSGYAINDVDTWEPTS